MLITFVGIDKAGKTTTINQVAERLLSHGLKVEIFTQPSPETKSFMRQNPHNQEAIILRLASDYQVVCNQIKSLNPNTIILCDRWFPYDVLAYQLQTMKCDVDYLANILSNSITKIKPDILFWIDADYGTILERQKGHNDIFENQDLILINSITFGYQRLYSDCLDKKVRCLEMPQMKIRVKTDDVNYDPVIFVESIIMFNALKNENL